MNQGIVIVTHPSNIKFLQKLIKSLKGYDEYPKYVVVNGETKSIPNNRFGYYDLLSDEYHVIFTNKEGFEVGALKKIYDFTNLDEFILLQDSVEIKDTSLFKKVFEEHKGISVGINKNFHSYLAKYTREALDKTGFPEVNSKKESIKAETHWHKEYKEQNPHIILDPNFNDSNKFKTINGDKCMVITNNYLTKYKRVWSEDMIK